MKKTVIHATNVNGLGAVQVVSSLLEPLLACLQGSDVRCYISRTMQDGISVLPSGVEVFRRRLPNGISRLREILFPPSIFSNADNILVLGDIPLGGILGQVVLVHQAHLIDPDIAEGSSRNFKFKVLRNLFGHNARFVKCFIVQSGAMKQGLMKTYGLSEEKIVVIPIPPPVWVKTELLKKSDPPNGIKLIYPAAAYAHKNHDVLGLMDPYIKKLKYPVEIVLTVDASDVSSAVSRCSWVKCVGRLSPDECLDLYRTCDGLFFPSLLESYGLPLVEAMTLGVPIVCANRPYARWMCEDTALYFDPFDAEDACQSIEELYSFLMKGETPDWTVALQKLPSSWDEVAEMYKLAL